MNGQYVPLAQFLKKVPADGEAALRERVELADGYKCPTGSPLVRAHLVAIQNRDFGFSETHYDKDRNIFDRDGLSFVLIEPPGANATKATDARPGQIGVDSRKPKAASAARQCRGLR